MPASQANNTRIAESFCQTTVSRAANCSIRLRIRRRATVKAMSADALITTFCTKPDQSPPHCVIYWFRCLLIKSDALYPIRSANSHLARRSHPLSLGRAAWQVLGRPERGQQVLLIGSGCGSTLISARRLDALRRPRLTWLISAWSGWDCVTWVVADK